MSKKYQPVVAYDKYFNCKLQNMDIERIKNKEYWTNSKLENWITRHLINIMTSPKQVKYYDMDDADNRNEMLVKYTHCHPDFYTVCDSSTKYFEVKTLFVPDNIESRDNYNIELPLNIFKDVNDWVYKYTQNQNITVYNVVFVWIIFKGKEFDFENLWDVFFIPYEIMLKLASIDYNNKTVINAEIFKRNHKERNIINDIRNLDTYYMQRALNVSLN